MADQGPRKGVAGGTRQGIYCLTASGKLLAFKNSTDAKVMRETIEQGLKRFQGLPEAERKAGAVTVPDHGKLDARFARTPPADGLILRAYSRILQREEGKEYAKGTCDFTGGDQAARDHVWLKKDEWQALIPAEPHVGQSLAMPAAVTRRLCRFHLLDNTRGEPESWRADQVRASELTWTVAGVSDSELSLTLTGKALMSTEADAEKSKRGYDVALRGELKYDRAKKAITRFDMVAVGDHWGRATFTPGARPGRSPLGVAFELVPGTMPAERVPPQAAREIAAYFAAK